MKTILGYIGFALFLTVGGLGAVLVYKVATDEQALRLFLTGLVAFVVILIFVMGMGVSFFISNYSARNGVRQALTIVEAASRPEAPKQDYPVTSYASYAARIVAPTTEVKP